MIERKGREKMPQILWKFDSKMRRAGVYSSMEGRKGEEEEKEWERE